MTTYDLGDSVLLSTNVTDPTTGLPADATMALAVTKPDGTAGSIGTVNHPSTGSYNASTTVTDQVGVWSYKWTASGALTAVDSGQFSVADPAPPAYASLAEIKGHLGIDDTAEDALLLKAIKTASRSIDNATNRRFWLDTTATQRLYNPARRILKTTGSQSRILVDDIGSALGLVVEMGSGTSFSPVTDYETWPENALVLGTPVFELSRTYTLWQYTTFDRLRVTARWGWPQVPDEISQATLILASRIFRRKASPEGVAGFNDLGVVRLSKMDPDVKMLISSFVVPVFG